MQISDEAVEAAAKANYEARTGNPWSNATNGQQAIERSWMRRSLVAAALHMLVEASTIEELGALPEGAMVRTDAGFYLKEALRRGISTWVTTNERYYFKSEDIAVPATVIYLPYRSQA